MASGQVGGGAQNWLIWAPLVLAAQEIREARNRRSGARTTGPGVYALRSARPAALRLALPWTGLYQDGPVSRRPGEMGLMAMDHPRPYHVRASGHASGPVEAWSGYPLQFAGQRRFGWQDEMAAELRDALAGLAVSPGDMLAATYLATGEPRCDVENRLFTNPGTVVFPKAVRSIRFERGLGQPPAPPSPVSRGGGQLHYYRYCLGGMWQSWEPAVPLARWHRVTRRVADDGSCRPVWLAMKQAAAAGQVEVLGPVPDDAEPFGLRITVHPTTRGPRRTVAISESLVDGIIAAFHAGASPADAAAAATALTPRLPGMTGAEIAALAAMSSPGPLFAASPFVIKGSYVQISPCDERCQAGRVTIGPGAEGPFMQISGELFTLRRRGS
jgi:hypothetical protein